MSYSLFSFITKSAQKHHNPKSVCLNITKKSLKPHKNSTKTSSALIQQHKTITKTAENHHKISTKSSLTKTHSQNPHLA
jgi:hypothetical protein